MLPRGARRCSASAEARLDPIYDALRGSPAALAALRIGIALAATLPAAACFGATYPALASAALGTPAALGSRGALLYGVNIARRGARRSSLASFVLPERIGVSGGHVAGVACLALAGGGALLASRALPATARAPAERPPRRRAPARARG